MAHVRNIFVVRCNPLARNDLRSENCSPPGGLRVRRFGASEFLQKFLPCFRLSHIETAGSTEHFRAAHPAPPAKVSRGNSTGDQCHVERGECLLVQRRVRANLQDIDSIAHVGFPVRATDFDFHGVVLSRKKAGGSSEQSTCDGPSSRVRSAALRLPPIKETRAIIHGRPGGSGPQLFRVGSHDQPSSGLCISKKVAGSRCPTSGLNAIASRVTSPISRCPGGCRLHSMIVHCRGVGFRPGLIHGIGLPTLSSTDCQP